MNRMKKISLLSGIMILGFCFPAKGQWIPQGPSTDKIVESTPPEQLYVHINSTLFFPGEYLLYKVYTIDGSVGKVKNISQIANVELISETGEQIFLQKVSLENGVGQADFFVPTTVPSGNYKLIAYTNWMRNFGDTFFTQDVVIINPYQAQQQNLLKEKDTFPHFQDSIEFETTRDHRNLMSLNKEVYGNREKVPIEISTGFGNRKGNYSLSVRKVSELPAVERVTAKQLVKSWQKVGVESNIFFLPEVRGQVLKGRIIPVNGETGARLEDRHISLSLPEEKMFPLIVATDEDGRFFFNLDQKRIEENIFLEILGEGKEDFEIELQKYEPLNFDPSQFSSYSLLPEMQEEILKRSIFNQIENAYFQVKPDTLVSASRDSGFHKSIEVRYDLDDYKRFKTVPETFVEIIGSAWIRRNENGERVFEVRGLGNSINMEQPPMILIDGVLIQDHNDLIELPAQNIKSISIIRKKIFRGPQIFQGAVLVQTNEEEFSNFYKKPYINHIKLNRPEIKKKYFHQTYNDVDSEKRIPDYRYQLLWMPNLEINGSGKTVELYTSDVDGDFEVVLEGFTEEGDPVSIRKTFSVQ